jgi:hypothetical protein
MGLACRRSAPYFCSERLAYQHHFGTGDADAVMAISALTLSGAEP